MLVKGEEPLTGLFPSVPKQARAQEKRQALLKSGSEMFRKKGFDQTTAKEIAANAGVSVGTFYRYFSDKRQLLLALLEDKLEAIIPPQPKWHHRERETFLAELLENHILQMEKYGIMRVVPELLLRDADFQEVMISVKKSVHKQILDGLRKAEDQGLTWSDLDLEMVSWVMMSIMEYLPAMQKDCGFQPNYQEIAKIICRMAFPPDGKNNADL